MLAFAWTWGRSAPDRFNNLSRKLAGSLCAGIGGHAGSAQVNDLHFAFRSLRSTSALAKAWRPAVLPKGRVAAFHGYFDNSEAIAAELGTGHIVPRATLRVRCRGVG